MPEAPWLTVLERLERDLARGSAASWAPPTGLGPLPPHLLPRARALQAAQADAIRAAEEEQRRVAAQLSALPRPATARISEAAYIDTVA